MSKYMLIMRTTDAALAASKDLDFEEIINAMGAFNDSLVSAGVLVDADGLSDAKEGFVVSFGGEQPVVTDGPYGETHELFNGFWIIDVPTKDDARAWASKAPLTAGDSLEVRRITEASDFEDFADNDYIKKESQRSE